MLGQGKNTWQAEIDAAAEVCQLLGRHHDSSLDLILYDTIAFRFLQFRCEVCRRALCATATQKCTGVLEVSRSTIYRPVLLSCAHSRVEYRALEGFVLAVSPFNFTAIGGNLPGSVSLSSFRGSPDLKLVLPSTRVGRECCSVETLACSHLFKLPCLPNSRGGRCPSWRHPIRTWATTRGRGASHRTS